MRSKRRQGSSYPTHPSPILWGPVWVQRRAQWGEMYNVLWGQVLLSVLIIWCPPALSVIIFMKLWCRRDIKSNIHYYTSFGLIKAVVMDISVIWWKRLPELPRVLRIKGNLRSIAGCIMPTPTQSIPSFVVVCSEHEKSNSVFGLGLESKGWAICITKGTFCALKPHSCYSRQEMRKAFSFPCCYLHSQTK